MSDLRKVLKMKQCTKCKQILPETEFYFRKDRNKLRNECKKCICNYQEKYRIEKQDKIKERSKKHYQKNKEKHSRYMEEYRRLHKEEKEVCNHNYYTENKKKLLIEKGEYYKKNKNQILEKHKRYNNKFKERVKEYIKNYRKKNKNKIYASNRKRRLKKKLLFEDFTIEEIEKKIAKTNGICPICNKSFKEGYGLSLDHTPPISKAPIGFHYTIENITPMCFSCNSSKSNHTGGI